MSQANVASRKEVGASEPSLRYVQANGLRFACLEQGEGPLILFLHGFPDNAWTYRTQLKVFADAGFHAVAPFLRGYAPTEIPADGKYDPATLGRDVHALIAALSGTGRAFLVGMDWGGTSIHAALAGNPSDVVAAVIMNTAHPISSSEFVRNPELVHRIFHFWFFHLDWSAGVLADHDIPIVDYLWKYWSPSLKDAEHIRSVKETLRSPGTLEAALNYYRALTRATLTNTFPGGPIHVPTLSMFGANDPTCPLSHMEEPIFRGPYNRVVLPEVGHFPHLEREKEFNSLVLDWFAAHPESRERQSQAAE